MRRQKTLTKTSILYTDHASGTLRARRYKVAVVAGPDVGASSEIDNGTFLLGTHPTTISADRQGRVALPPRAPLRADGIEVRDLDTTNGTKHGGARSARSC